jgi:hypothetical protein
VERLQANSNILNELSIESALIKIERVAALTGLDTVTLGQVFLQILRFSLPILNPPTVP